MATVVVTGSAGLVGSEAARFYASKGFKVLGIDNDMRARFFGPLSSTARTKEELLKKFGDVYRHYDVDIRDDDAIQRIFEDHACDIVLVIHTAAQPSHDWAARDPVTDFTVNANGTLVLLEACRRFSKEAAFIFTSTNKVYGDSPNRLPLIEMPTRWELPLTHPLYAGIDESMSIDTSLHSIFGASKVAADVLVQEYGKYFGMKTAVFRGGCLTGPGHAGAELHGFLAYLMQCAIEGRTYTIHGYRGKQVRDNLHSADLIRALDEYFQSPRCGEVYNMGGSRLSNCSILEAIALCDEITGRKLQVNYAEQNRIGDHIWYITDVSKFRAHYPTWEIKNGIREILVDIYDAKLTAVA